MLLSLDVTTVYLHQEVEEDAATNYELLDYITADMQHRCNYVVYIRAEQWVENVSAILLFHYRVLQQPTLDSLPGDNHTVSAMSQLMLRSETVASFRKYSYTKDMARLLGLIYSLDCSRLGSTYADSVTAVHAGYKKHYTNGKAQSKLSIWQRTSSHSSISAGNVLHSHGRLPDSPSAIQKTSRKIHEPLEGSFLPGH